MDITTKVPWDSIRIEDTGNHDSATADFVIRDKALAYTAIRGEWGVLIAHGGTKTFRGTMGPVRPDMVVIHADVNVSARDIGTLLDRRIITAAGTKRTNSESDKARIGWLFSQAWAEDFQGLNFSSKVQTLNASMPNQTFPAGMYLRQALERILSGASESSDYYIDNGPRLHTFDNDNPESDTAPFKVNLTQSPAADEVAPETFEFEWDPQQRRGGLYVKGRNGAGSGYVTDNTLGMAGPFSNDIFGRADDVFSAPDADTVAKRNRAAKAVLHDIRNPLPRGSFTVTEPYITRSGITWAGGQLVYIWSTEHGLNGSGTDAGPWAGANGSRLLQPFRITRVITTYVNGLGERMMEIEIGPRPRHLYGNG